MKLKSFLLAATLIFPLFFVSFLSISVSTVTAQDTTKIALQRGYRTGYSDGYMAGYRDSIENAAQSYDRHREYLKADRAYTKEYGSLEDYKDGYQQGFEGGYATGFEKRSFNAVLPADLKRRGVNTVSPQPVATPEITSKPITNEETDSKPPTITPKNEPETSQATGDPIILIPTDTELVIELIEDLSTEKNKEGDKFTARIVSPNEINGAIIEGKITKIQMPGRIKRRSELSLAFDRIILTDTRWSNFNAILLQVMPIKGDNISKVDVEGTVQGQSSVKGDAFKVGAATGTGAVAGAVVGGPAGAAIGAGVGAAFGVGAVVVERGKHIKMTKGQQLRIKTAFETTIR